MASIKVPLGAQCEYVVSPTMGRGEARYWTERSVTTEGITSDVVRRDDEGYARMAVVRKLSFPQLGGGETFATTMLWVEHQSSSKVERLARGIAKLMTAMTRQKPSMVLAGEGPSTRQPKHVIASTLRVAPMGEKGIKLVRVVPTSEKGGEDATQHAIGIGMTPELALEAAGWAVLYWSSLVRRKGSGS